jgi:hypothetical protein
MMPGLMAENDVPGQFHLLISYLQGKAWADIWKSLGFTIHTFDELGLSPKEKDVVVWQVCQQHDIVLITGNRNREGPDSLEAAIHERNTIEGLPVITLADTDRIVKDKTYAKQTATRLIEVLFDLESYRGAGRIYVP